METLVSAAAATSISNPLPKFINDSDMIFFKTEIFHDGPVFSFSDVHGDIHALIILLRDCAKVISKKDYGGGTNLDVVDPDIEHNLNIDISIDDNGYNDTLGYSWCGGNSCVVICGDMIDPNRQNTHTYNYKMQNINVAVPNCYKIDCRGIINCTYYPQVEIKLLRFINAINDMAVKNGGRIIKLLGNHEAGNIVNEIYINYSFKDDIDKPNYYRGLKRSDVFNIGNEGFNILFKDGCGILVKINNTIFVHGKLPNKENIIDINKKNQILNNTNLNTVNIKEICDDLFGTNDGPLQSRYWGDENIYNNYIQARKKGESSPYCYSIKNSIWDFLLGKIDMRNIENYRVVIGHCVQSNASVFNEDFKENTTFQNMETDDSVSKTYNITNAYTGVSNPSDQGKIFGITMGCEKMMNKDYFVYRVDVGVSREFDIPYNYILDKKFVPSIFNIDSKLDDNPKTRENIILFSKTPQLLAINKQNSVDSITIIKSKMWNTRIHLPRHNYEKKLDKTISGADKTNQVLKLDKDHTGKRLNYDKKYLKYKMKYLELKKLYKTN
jgi:hypothetical protein